MKKLHLICNSHIDPVWLWQWEEGMAAALATFRSAAKLAQKYDFIFCHNEALLYEFIQRHDAGLFSKMQELAKENKWHVMGGWYLQPDCLMPGGETLVRQIQAGKKYFSDNFNQTPRTAISLDSFGHSVGIVQILRKTGYDSYLMCRPHFDMFPVKENSFIWQGLDGSTVKATRDPFHYSSPMGEVVKKIHNEIDTYNKSGTQTGVCLWGVGNHGGGPSEKDLCDIKDLQNTSDFEIVHSTPEQYFSEINPSLVFDKSLVIVFPGCYTSMMNVKRKFVELENQLFFTEKISSAAALQKKLPYQKAQIDSAQKDLLFCSFHDILPGTAIEDGEQDSIRTLNHGLDVLNKVKADAFFSLIKNQPPAKADSFPIFAFNPHPYEYNTTLECEFMLPKMNWDLKNVSQLRIFDGDKELDCQLEKESPNLNVEWRLKAVFDCTLKPFQISRFDAFVHFDKPVVKAPQAALPLPIEFMVYSDNADPWGMSKEQRVKMGSDPEIMKLISERIIEDGAVRTVCERIYKYNKSTVVACTKNYKNYGYTDVTVRVIWQENCKMLKMHYKTDKKGGFSGQVPFGTEQLFEDGRECLAHRFVSIGDSDESFAIINDGTFGVSYDKEQIMLSLLRSPHYSAHPMLDEETNKIRPLVDSNRFNPTIDHGKHIFNFRIGNFKTSILDTLAAEFNQKPMALNVFTDGGGVENSGILSLSNKDISLVTIKQADAKENSYIIRLLNNSAEKRKTQMTICGESVELEFSKYEAKTIVFDGREILESSELII